MSRPPFPRFQQRLIEGLLIRNKSPLVVYLLLVLDKPLSPHLCLFLLYLLGNEELQPQVGPLFEQVLDVLELLLALAKGALDHLGVAEGLQLHGERLEVERGGVEDVVDLVGEQFHPFFEFSNGAHNKITRWVGYNWLRGGECGSGKEAIIYKSKCNEPQNNYRTMNKQFETSFKKRNHRERFYSSMGYDDYCDLFGPPSPLFKPQEDPVDDMPLFDLQPLPQPDPSPPLDPPLDDKPSKQKMETIPEIDGSENFTQNLQRSPKVDIFASGLKSREVPLFGKDPSPPKRVRVRMRSQSDNSEYLIFNFLERNNENGRKKRKMDE